MGLSKICASIRVSLDSECKAFMCKISGKGNFEGNGEIFMDRLLYSGPPFRLPPHFQPARAGTLPNTRASQSATGIYFTQFGPSRAGQLKRRAAAPVRISTAAVARHMVNGSFRTKVEIRSAKRMLVSRKAATAPMGACVMAQSAIQ